MAFALEGLTLAGPLFAARQRDALVAAATLPTDLAKAEVRFPARAVIAAQEFSARRIPELADRDPTEFLRIGPALQADDVPVMVADVLVVALKRYKSKKLKISCQSYAL